MLEVLHLRKRFSTVVAVDDISFAVNEGDIFGLIGPNGAGKTTTIRMLLNILRPDSGAVTYRGLPFSDGVRNTSGYLPEERGLYRKSRVLDAMLYFAELRGMDRSSARTAASLWLSRLGLEEHAQRKTEELSKGNQQKVQFAVCLLHDPWLVILDEPFSGLDPVNQELLKGILLELKQKGKAIIFSTHQMEQAEQLSDRICLVNKGRVVLQGSLPGIRRTYGRNSVKVEFSGDGSFLKNMKGIGAVRLYPHSAEIELPPGTSHQSVLRQMIDRIEVHSFQLVEPSLQAIFVDAVAEKGGGGKT